VTTVELTVYQLIYLGVLSVGGLIGIWKYLDRGRAAAVKEATNAATTAAKASADKADELEKAFLRHLARLPLDYVRREDWIRNQTIIEAKLDGLASKLETLGRGHGC